ncbi:MAG: hypothetical protein ACI4VS_02690 [Candidatus Nanosyncoccaceae bacterium]
MALNGKIIQRITGVKSSDVMHSSGYANAQNAGSFGVAAGETFEQRQEIEKNRKIVQGYNRAKAAQRTNMMPKARTYQQELEEKRQRKLGDQTDSAEQGRQEFNTSLERGGLRSFEEKRIGGYADRQATFAAQKEARTATGQARSSESRQAIAARFNGTARPAPKTGGFGPNFGRH